MKDVYCDIAIIGAGPAGLAAAIAAYDEGAKNVVLIERDKYLGGILQQCIHNGFGVHLLGEDKTGPEYAEYFIDKLKDFPITCFTETMVVELSDDLSIQAVNRGGVLCVKPRAIVLAMGCRERTRGAIALPGKRPAGIMTAGTAQRFINIEGYLPGKKVLILGSGDIGMIMARRLYLEGAEVKGVVEIMDRLGGLTRNFVQCLQDFNIPLYLKHVVTDIKGDRRVERVDFAPLGDDGRVLFDRTISVDCDTLLLSVGLIPENELSKQVGIDLDGITQGPIVDQYFHTSVPGVFSAGNVVQVFDLVDYVSICGMQAGRSAARYIADKLPHFSGKASKVKAGENIRSVVPQVINHHLYSSEEIRFYIRVQKVMRKVTLRLKDDDDKVVFTKRFSIVRPAEMISVSLADFKPSADEYVFDLIGVEDDE